MALYLGKDKVKINLDGVVYKLNLLTDTSSATRCALLSSDNYVLKDINGVYLIPKDCACVVEDVLLSLDNFILQDLNGLYLKAKENE